MRLRERFIYGTFKGNVSQDFLLRMRGFHQSFQNLNFLHINLKSGRFLYSHEIIQRKIGSTSG